MGYTRLNPGSESVTSGLFEPATGITVVSQRLLRSGRAAQLELQIKHDAAWSVGSQYNVGTVAVGYRPAVHAGGVIGTYGVGALLTGGQVYMRPLYATEAAAGSTSYVRFSYLLA